MDSDGYCYDNEGHLVEFEYPDEYYNDEDDEDDDEDEEEGGGGGGVRAGAGGKGKKTGWHGMSKSDLILECKKEGIKGVSML